MLSRMTGDGCLMLPLLVLVAIVIAVALLAGAALLIAAVSGIDMSAL